MNRRPLGEVLAEVGLGALPAAGGLLRVRSVSVALPMEFALQQVAGQTQLLGELPRGRWRTDFDPLPSRLELRLEARDEQ